MKRPVPAQNPFASIGMPSSGRALATQTRNSTVTLARFRSDDPDFSVLKRLSADDSYVLIFQRTNMPGHEVWTGGRHLRRPPTRQAALNIFDVNSAPACRLTGRFDNIHLHIPRGTLDDLADEAGARPITELHAPDGWDTSDPVIETMQAHLVAATERPDEVSQLFVDHVVLALHAHIAQTYGGMRKAERRGGLAPWQERRARDMVAANFASEMSLQRIAQECGLSVSHFSRAFKLSTGLTPHAWLQTCRVEHAKTLLQDPDRTLAEIAGACGFADQSHFTRIFARVAGATPGAWRRVRRAA